MADYVGDAFVYYKGAGEEDPILTFAFHTKNNQLLLDVSGEKDKKESFRQRYEREVAKVQDKYKDLEPEFSDDDMNATLEEADRKRGWQYPLTKTQQKKEFGCVPAEQQRFLWRLQDGHIDIVEDYLGNPKMKKAIDLNRYDDEGLTPLHHAAKLGHADIVKVLIEGMGNVLQLFLNMSKSHEIDWNRWIFVDIDSWIESWHDQFFHCVFLFWCPGKADPLLRDKVSGLTALDFAEAGRWDSGPHIEAVKAIQDLELWVGGWDPHLPGKMAAGVIFLGLCWVAIHDLRWSKHTGLNLVQMFEPDCHVFQANASEYCLIVWPSQLMMNVSCQVVTVGTIKNHCLIFGTWRNQVGPCWIDPGASWHLALAQSWEHAKLRTVQIWSEAIVS